MIKVLEQSDCIKGESARTQRWGPERNSFIVLPREHRPEVRAAPRRLVKVKKRFVAAVLGAVRRGEIHNNTLNQHSSPPTLTLWLRSFSSLTSNWHGDNFYIPWPGTEFFFIVAVWHGLFLILEFQVLWFPPLSGKVQGKCISKIFKVENQENKFLSLYLPSIDKPYFSSFQGW